MMSRDRIVQIVAACVLVLSAVASGSMLPGLIRISNQSALRYTNETVEGAPPIVALGTAIGALRGIIVDYLWVKVFIQKERGLFYEVMADADLITKLQPRFPAVWAFHGHNMAYNISVATHTQEDRWEWVNAGIRLVREKGLRYNPNDMTLHKELGFWLAHKIDGYTDEAHLYYKEKFCHEWHMLLGSPPPGEDARLAWIQAVADAPATLDAVLARSPQAVEILERLRTAMPGGQSENWTEINYQFCERYTMWEAVKQSPTAEMLGTEAQWRRQFPQFSPFDQVASDPELAEGWNLLLNHARKRILIDEYNMDPKLMAQYTRELGPLDWRHAQAHALYWTRRGSTHAEGRTGNDNIYVVLNNDRLQIQSLQALTRTGRMTYDPVYQGMPTRFPDPRFIDSVKQMFGDLYVKHYDVRGAGGETFFTFLQNYLAASVRELYRSGEIERAQEQLDELDRLFGTGAREGLQHRQYKKPLEEFVHDEVFDQYHQNPMVAPADVAQSLKYGIKVGIGMDNERVFREAIRFANDVTTFFKENDWYRFTNQFGRRRIAELVAELEWTLQAAYFEVMLDPEIRMEDRMAIWSQTDRYEPTLRGRVYDRMMRQENLPAQWAGSPLSRAMSLNEAFPPPPNLDQVREMLRQELEVKQQRINEAAAQDQQRDPTQRQ